MRITPIRSDADHTAALARIDALMNAEADSPEADELAVLGQLVQNYEAKRFPIELPDPIDAIRFRMEQLGWEPRDLAPYIGSSGKVSDVLSGKQPLTLPMIRALTRDLGIPAEVLVREAQTPVTSLDDSAPMALDWRRFPVREMAKRGWIRANDNPAVAAESLVGELVAAAGGMRALATPLFRRNDAMRTNAKTDTYALLAWSAKALAEARREQLTGRYRQGSIDLNFLAEVARLSTQADGPRQAKTLLSTVGVQLVCVRHLPRTYLDGAAFWDAERATPIIALTLRYDRVDNFWFSLLHELAHIGRHFDGSEKAFVDDFTLRDAGLRHEDIREREADEWAEEALIPQSLWDEARLISRPTYNRILSFAQRANVHPAIVAGRIRHQSRNFRAFAPLLGNGEVSEQLEVIE